MCVTVSLLGRGVHSSVTVGGKCVYLCHRKGEVFVSMSQ